MSHWSLQAVVLNYCQLEETIGCVEALAATGLPEDRILVVDNASPDGSGDALEERLRGPAFLRLPRNEGYGPGNNAAIEFLWSRPGPPPTHVFIVNPDVRVRPGAPEELLDVLAGKRRGGAACIEYEATEGRRLDPFFADWLKTLGAEPAELEERRFIAAPTLLGAAMMLTREAIERVGGFDPLYFMYAEERDLSRRLRYHGFEIGLACGAEVTHRRPYLSGMEERGGREAQKRTSQYLYRLKDPLHPFAFNVYQVLRWAGFHLSHVLTRDDVTVRDWAGELAWVGRRILPALRHRRLEMRGRAHLQLPAAASSGGELPA